MSDHRLPERDRPWMMRTYAGHSTAARSNELYRRNLAKGQTGLSVAFDLPTQTGYDADHELARGEVGKVGVPVAHRGDMHALLDGIPLDRDEHVDDDQRDGGVAAGALHRRRRGAGRRAEARSRARPRTTSSRSTSRAAPTRSRPAPSMRLIADMVAYTVEHVPKWNPINICSYHLQEAGATPVQEIAYAMATRSRCSTRSASASPQDRMGAVFGRISFFVNAGVRFVEEHAKLRAMGDAVGRARPRALRRRGPASTAASATACRSTRSG